MFVPLYLARVTWVIGLSACFLLRVLASDGSGYPQSIPVDDSRLLYDVPTDDPEQSRPMPPGFILLAGVSCKRPIRVGGVR